MLSCLGADSSAEGETAKHDRLVSVDVSMRHCAQGVPNTKLFDPSEVPSSPLLLNLLLAMTDPFCVDHEDSCSHVFSCVERVLTLAPTPLIRAVRLLRVCAERVLTLASSTKDECSCLVDLCV